ncbi:transglycosylase SLT domain-containing protein [Streptomyces afghaniensis]|uniref:transglycosylase SLT domain-containing protein n=1 Tax=Streptomyces afghaniensis TaxID=66865 RepID=UPI00278BA63D|nr:transglycosylase SLT domain-containing protein [Streptomyces afghaniensis]MDQ1016696.1 SLT domain-containing protein [Streptomyces afghaniensis]
MAEGHGPIKVGTGYIEIIPKVLQKDVEDLRRKVQREMQALGVKAAKDISEGAKKGLAALPAEVDRAAKKANESTKKRKKESAKDLKRIEEQITREYGEEAAKRWRTFRDLEQKKEKALKRASSATKTALRETVRQEEQAARQRQTAAERLEKDRLRLLRQGATDHARLELQKTRLEQAQERLRIQALREANRTRDIEAREASRIRIATMQQETARYRAELQQQTAAQRIALRAQVQAQRDAVRQQVAALREQAAAQRATLQAGIADQQARMTTLRDQIRDLNRNINTTNTTTQSYFAKTGTALRRMGTWFDQVGMSINEAANILTTRFLAPLAGAGAALTAIGVENADKRLLGQLGLSSAGVSKSASAEQMRLIQEYAINTPFSIDVMHEYQMKLIRSVAGTDKNWYSKDAGTRTKAANSAAAQTTDLIMAIGDSMARAGNLNPQQFTRAMYAMDMIMDMDRAPTKNVKQLAAASGMPASELAALLGFKNSTEMWKVIGTPAKDGGGVTGRQIMDAMLNYWNPQKYKGGSATGEGSKGFAATMTSETITGRLQQMKERASFELGNLFVEEGKGGQYQYTELGNRIAGEDGILNQITDLAKKWAPKVDDFLGLFLDGVETFISTIDWIATKVEESGLADLAKPITEFLLKWGPLILAVGLLSKVVGKAAGLVGRLFAPAAAVTRAGVRAYEGQRDIRSQRRAARDARNEARGNGASRRDARQAGRDAYRQQRTTNRNGDTRTTRQRLLDGFMGRDSREADGQRQMRALEDQIREARDEAVRLRDELRETNRESMRQITAALAGNGSGSVQGAANQAGQAVNSVQTQAQQANNASLNQLRQEVEKVEKAARDVVSRLGTVKNDVDALNGKNLNAVTTEFSQLRTAAEEAGKQITSDNTRVGNLDGKRVGGVTGSVNDLRDAAKKAADQIGDGAMSSSTSGRVANLNKRRLTDVIQEFKKLTSSADDAYKKIGQGTGAGSLAGRVGLLNGRSLAKVKGHVDDLAKALKKAKDEGDGLDDALGRIGKKSPGGGGSSGSGKKKRARGGVMRQSDVSSAGVLPGYSPWVDNIPAILSPGESVLRPEVTNALGEETINTWNSLAVRGKISRHARGTSGGGSALNLDAIREMIDLQNIAPVGAAMLKTMKLDGSSDPLGGSVQGGILRTGDHSAGIGGSVTATKFRGMYDWMTEDLFSLLKRVPSGVGQIAGILGGALGPVLGDYFWSDVWKGSGNIVDRGKRYMGHVFSMETVSKVWDNLFSGVKDSASSIWDLATDPFGAISDAFDDIGGIFSGSYNSLIDMVDTVKEIRDAPMAYAGRVLNGVMANAQEAMPNTKGLFDFSSGSKVTANIPDIANMIIEPGSGKGVQRWAPVAAQALAMLGLPSSALSLVMHRIGVESGGNPTVVNKWDSNWKMGHPSVGLMQVIGPTFQRWAGPFRKTGPFLYGTSVNPLANIYAGLNYARNRYGGNWQKALSGNKGYATGTISASPGLAMVGEKGRELVAFGGGERVFNNEETEGILNGKRYEIHVHEARNEPTPQAVLRALQTAEALYL